jgi:prolyl oligopeptidase
MRLGVWVALSVGVATILGWQAMAAETDPYIWLEDVHGDKPMAWVKEQNVKTLGVLTADPNYQKDYDAVLKVMDATDRIPYGNIDHNFVFNFWQDAEHPKGVWRRTTIADYANPTPKWETLLDLDKLSADEHENWVWKGTDCTPSLTRCLVNLSRGGGDAVVIREFDLAAKSFLKDGFTLPEAKATATYFSENLVLFGTDFGKGSMTTSGYPRIVKEWRRGQTIADATIAVEGKDADVSVSPIVFHSDEEFPIIVRAPSFFETEYYLREPITGLQTEPIAPVWLKLAVPLSAQIQGMLHGRLLFTLRENWTPPHATAIAKGSLIAVTLAKFNEIGSVAVLYAPGPRSTVDEVSVGRDAVYASIYDNVIGSIHAFRFDPAKNAWSDTKLDLPGHGSTHIVSTDDYGPEAEFRFENFVTPTTLYADSGDDRPVAIKSLPARFDASNLTTDQFEATSKDGTKIPYFVTRAKNSAGPAPTVLYGYGGFEISETPVYSTNFGQLWLSKGGVYVLANIRGGGEFGPAWHQAALNENRQKAYDDFQAVAGDLISRGITTTKQLGIMGGSNGGLLVSANMVERPDLFGAVVCQVPLIDMIRYTQIGAGASWIAEYGDPADAKARAWILKYSPYQNVKPDVKYPPVLFVTATSDDRVTPVHARKMAAKMLAQGHDVMFYENTDGGHAAAANHKQAAEMWALSFVYLREKLGLGK